MTDMSSELLLSKIVDLIDEGSEIEMVMEDRGHYYFSMSGDKLVISYMQLLQGINAEWELDPNSDSYWSSMKNVDSVINEWINFNHVDWIRCDGEIMYQRPVK